MMPPPRPVTQARTRTPNRSSGTQGDQPSGEGEGEDADQVEGGLHGVGPWQPATAGLRCPAAPTSTRTASLEPRMSTSATSRRPNAEANSAGAAVTVTEPRLVDPCGDAAVSGAASTEADVDRKRVWPSASAPPHLLRRRVEVRGEARLGRSTSSWWMKTRVLTASSMSPIWVGCQTGGPDPVDQVGQSVSSPGRTAPARVVHEQRDPHPDDESGRCSRSRRWRRDPGQPRLHSVGHRTTRSKVSQSRARSVAAVEWVGMIRLLPGR